MFRFLRFISFISLFFSFVSCSIIPRLTKENLANNLKSLSIILNRKTPIQLDDQITLLNSKAEGNKLTYFYEFRNYTKKQLNTNKLAEFLENDIKNKVCKIPRNKEMFELGAIFDYQYSDKEDIKLFNIIINYKNCNLESKKQKQNNKPDNS